MSEFKIRGRGRGGGAGGGGGDGGRAPGGLLQQLPQSLVSHTSAGRGKGRGTEEQI